MSGIFPMIQTQEAQAAASLPLCREVAWDYQQGAPIFSGGRPVVVTGARAVQVWAWKAVKTARFRHDIYSWAYGCEAEALVGKPFTAAVKESEAVRYIREALATNPYITGVRQVAVDFSGTRLSVSCAVSTIYGEVDVNV